jgi:hypothetical protein
MPIVGNRTKRALLALLAGAALYGGAAYGIAPSFWRHYERQRALADKSMETRTSLGIPGDVFNVGIEGTRDDILCAMGDAGWLGVDPVNFRTSARIIGDVLVRRPYATAPVSPLFYEGRIQDLAFQKPSFRSPSTRHHVRFWRVLDRGDQGQPVWLGAATFDRSVGLSHYTGQVTHHISPDIDAERELLSADLAESGHAESTYEVSGVGPTLYARNGGGDPYFTDGEIKISRLRTGCQTGTTVPEAMKASPTVMAKNAAFRWLAKAWRAARF